MIKWITLNIHEEKSQINNYVVFIDLTYLFLCKKSDILKP